MLDYLKLENVGPSPKLEIDFKARFNDGRFRATTEAKLPPLARFGCSMVWRWISVFRAGLNRFASLLAGG